MKSNAAIQIRMIRALGVVTDNELARFSDSTRNFIVAEFSGFRSSRFAQRKEHRRDAYDT
jgi:hypothetical protein